MNRCRAWFAWSFLLATIVVQGPHAHDRPASPVFIEEFGSCEEAGRHWAGHEPSAHQGGADACPICQLRSQPALVEPVPARFGPIGSRLLPDAAPPRPSTGPSLRPRCRAPPEG